MEKKIEGISITDVKDGFVVFTNSDRTEGRGFPVPLFWCTNRFTAQRKSVGVSVQGSNGDVIEHKLFRVNGTWYGPIRLEYSSKEDDNKEKEYQVKLMKEEQKEQAINKAKELGLSDADIDALRY